MISEKDAKPGPWRVQHRMAVLTGGAALIVYLATLCGWISLLSLPTVASLSGWLWYPDFGRPLTRVVLAPFRLLPDAWVPLALNGFTAACAATVLVLLFRSVLLLPQDTRPEGSVRVSAGADLLTGPQAWMPPVLAAVACGLQLSYWEHATSVTGEMIPLIAFAYALRCLLEYRVAPRAAWLFRCVFVYAAGMADSWVLVAYSPVFLAGVIWVRGYGRFLEGRFLLRLGLWALAGGSFYLLAAILASVSAPEVGFGMALKAHLKAQKDALLVLGNPAYRVLLLSAVLPFPILAIRWKSHTIQATDDSRLGVFITRAVGHFIHAGYFLVALWITLDPFFGPRTHLPGNPMLPYHYSWALALGYCAGYLLMFGVHAAGCVGRRLPGALLWVLLGFWPAWMIGRNLPEIRCTNGPALRAFASDLVEGLPSGTSIALSEDPRRLLLTQGWIERSRSGREPLLVDTTQLTLPGYQKFLIEQHGAGWPVGGTDGAGDLQPMMLRAITARLAAREPVVYLHPSSGHYVEPFAVEPRGLVHHLHPDPTPLLEPAALSEEVLTGNEAWWQQRWREHLHRLVGQVSRGAARGMPGSGTVRAWLRISRQPNATASFLAAAYSKSLTHWGVTLQRHGHWDEAGVWFRRAIELNSGNISAAINLEFNERRLAGEGERLEESWIRQWSDRQGLDLSDWWPIIARNGPVDEPTCLCRSGSVFLSSNNPRQAGRAFQRCLELAPDWPIPKLWLARTLNRLGDFQTALTLADEAEEQAAALRGADLSALLQCRVAALAGLGRTNDVGLCLDEFVTRHGAHNEVISTAAYLHGGRAEYAEGLELINTLVDRNPHNPRFLGRKGLAELRTGRFKAAVRTLSEAVDLAPADNMLLRLRAMALMGSGEWEAAREDYLILLKRRGQDRGALLALGGLSLRMQQTNAAMDYYREFLVLEPQDSPRYEPVLRRLESLSAE